MSKIVRNKDYDHPEHFADKIEEYNSEQRYIPTPLLDLLLEQAGHRCTICKENCYDLHHINFLNDGGKTEYDNLIALCPNCHRRVHKENIPNPQQLKHYKLKLEVSYSLPILGHLTIEEKKLISEISQYKTLEELLTFSERFYEVIENPDQEEAKKIFRKKIGLFNLELNEIIALDYGFCISSVEQNSCGINLHLRLTPRGIKWIDYLNETKRIELLK